MTVFLLAGCGRQVEVAPAPNPPALCTTLSSFVPENLEGIGRRPTTPESPSTAAWGEPPIVLRCGVPRPAALTETSVLLDIDGVTWFPEPLAAGTAFTTTGWPPEPAASPVFVEVRIPDEYPAPAALLTGLAPALAQAGAAP
jgi:hypothetical protein